MPRDSPLDWTSRRYSSHRERNLGETSLPEGSLKNFLRRETQEAGRRRIDRQKEAIKVVHATQLTNVSEEIGIAVCA